MVKDKINYRARGPNTALTRQSVQGRANDGGLRIGEMERDAIISHGASQFLNESFLVRGDEYYMAVCNKTGAIAIYNNSKNLFLSPFADGPIKFHTTLDNKMNVENISRFGRSFSILRIPYSLKLLIQELQVMNVQMRIITDKNVDQLVSMSYSDNIIELTKNNPNFAIDTNSSEVPKEVDKISGYVKAYANRLSKSLDKRAIKPDYTQQPNDDYSMQGLSPSYAPDSSAYSPAYSPDNSSVYSPGYSPAYAPETSNMEFEPHSPEGPPPQKEITIELGSPELNAFFESLPPKSKASILALPERDQRIIVRMIKDKKESKKSDIASGVETPKEILNVEESKTNEDSETQGSDNNSLSSSGEIKSISIDTGNEPSGSNTGNLKKITF